MGQLLPERHLKTVYLAKYNFAFLFNNPTHSAIGEYDPNNLRQSDPYRLVFNMSIFGPPQWKPEMKDV